MWIKHSGKEVRGAVRRPGHTAPASLFDADFESPAQPLALRALRELALG
jgi:hypothetical protein